MKKSSVLYSIFILAVIADLFFVITGNDTARFVSKPLLLFSLLMAFVLEIKQWNGSSLLFSIGLFFSWVGDILLMFEYRSPVFFIGGLSSFLAAHFCYIFYFLRIREKNQSAISGLSKFILAGVVLYILLFLFILWPGLHELKLPVTIYALTIGTMLVTAVLLKGKIDARHSALFLAGAALFVLSDSMLALNKFRYPFALASPLIMISYCAAQFLLTRASAAHQNAEQLQ